MTVNKQVVVSDKTTRSHFVMIKLNVFLCIFFDNQLFSKYKCIIVKPFTLPRLIWRDWDAHRRTPIDGFKN